MKLLIMQPSPVTSSLLGPNILLSTLFSNILNQCSSLSVRDKVSHPYKTLIFHAIQLALPNIRLHTSYLTFGHYGKRVLYFT